MDFLGNPGGLLDFTEIYPVIPTIVVPDLHARADFMLDILKYKPVIKETDINGKKNILDLMRSGSMLFYLPHLIWLSGAGSLWQQRSDNTHRSFE